MTEEGLPKVKASAFLKAGSSAVVSQAIAFLLLPFLFRLYGPSDFGAWATIQAVVMATASLGLLRYDLAVVTEKNEDHARLLFWLCMALGLVVASAAAIAGGVWASTTRSTYLTLPTFGIGSLWLTMAVVNQPVQAWLLRHGRFGAAALTVVIATAGTNIGQLLAATIWPDHRGLIAGSAVGATLGSLAGLVICRSGNLPWMTVNWGDAGEMLVKHRRFVQFSLPFTVLSLARERAPVLILSLFAPAAVVGIYSQAWRLVHLPAGLTSGALRPVVFHAAARSGLPAVDSLVQRIIAGMALICAPWLGLAMSQHEFLFALLLGEEWKGAGVYAALLAVPAVLFMLTNWLDRLLDVAQRQDMNLKLEVVAAVLSVGAFWIVLSLNASLAVVTAVQASALAASYCLVLFVVYRICGFPLRPLVRTLVLSALLASSVFAVTFWTAEHYGAVTAVIAGSVVAATLSVAAALLLLRSLLVAFAQAR